MPWRKFKTRRTWNEPGHAHELTFCCYRRYPFLRADRTRQWFLNALQMARRRFPLELWAYVIMPEHVHLLLWPTSADVDIGAVRKAVKLAVSRRAIAHIREYHPEWLERLRVTWPDGRVEHHFWQAGGGYDRNLLREDAVWAAIDYIHANPVRRGLCRIPEDWEWSSARWYAGVRPTILEMDGPPPTPTPGTITRRRR
ncbi:Transposase IS200 like protein [Phycisphaerae bacterium RAS1]|nr:Transposase IS200 like protein [Phycisphaerae bacterium RAS1]